MKPTFIHIPKTGGMSVRHGTRGRVRVAGPENHKSPAYSKALLRCMNQYGEHHGYEHARWRDLRPEIQQGPCFAAVRNPWARVASRYWFGRQVIETGRAPASYTFSTFDEFLAERERWGAEPFFWHRAVRGWYPAFDHVSDESGKIRCAVLRTEHLADDVACYLGYALPAQRRNVTARRGDYHTLYDDRTTQLVADWYAVDIDTFGFDLDTPATRGLWEGLEV